MCNTILSAIGFLTCIVAGISFVAYMIHVTWEFIYWKKQCEHMARRIMALDKKVFPRGYR